MLRPGTFALTALLAALSAVGPLTTDMYLPSLPDIVRLLGATTAEGQLTISAYLVGFAVGQIVYGPLSDRHGRKPVLIGAIALYCFASLVCALSISIEMLIAARALQALGGCGGIVLARAVVRDLYSGSRAGRELSLIGSVMALAPVLAPIGGGMLQTAFGWQSVFLTLVLAGLSGVAVIWLLLPETLALRAAEPVSFGSMLKSYRLVARNPGLSRLFGARHHQLRRAVRLDLGVLLRAAEPLRPDAFQLRRHLRDRLARLHDRRDARRAPGGAARHRRHHRYRLRGHGRSAASAWWPRWRWV